MRICLVSREIAPFFGGGIGSYAARWAAALRAQAHEVHLLTEAHPGLLEHAPTALPGVCVHTVDLSRGAAALDAYPMHPMRHAMGVREALRDLHQRHPFDVVEFPDYWGEGYFSLSARRSLGELPGAVLVVRLHTLTRLCQEFDRDDTLDLPRAVMDRMERSCVEDADLVITPTRAVLDAVATRVRHMPPSALVPLPALPSSAPPPSCCPSVVTVPLRARDPLLRSITASQGGRRPAGRRMRSAHAPGP